MEPCFLIEPCLSNSLKYCVWQVNKLLTGKCGGRAVNESSNE